MNLLGNMLPREVEIEGQRYQLNTGFRTGLRIVEAFEDPELTPGEQQTILLQLLYPAIPSSSEGLQKALELGIKFLAGGSEMSQATGGPRLYSFTTDGELIFSGILSCHGVDLSQEPELHWWKFCALFRELRDDCIFCRLVSLRHRLLRGTASKEERRLAAALGPAAFPPPSPETPEAARKAEEFFQKLDRYCPAKKEGKNG